MAGVSTATAGGKRGSSLYGCIGSQLFSVRFAIVLGCIGESTCQMRYVDLCLKNRDNVANGHEGTSGQGDKGERQKT
jgi:hypothetical protein